MKIYIKRWIKIIFKELLITEVCEIPLEMTRKGGIGIYKKIQSEIKTLEDLHEQVGKAIEGLPKGTLRCTNCRETDQFYLDGKYISKKQTNLIRDVAQREYYEQALPVIERRLKILYEMEACYKANEIENCYTSLCNARKKLVAPLYESVEEKIKSFLEEEYESGKFDEKNYTEFISLKGERVRSKSELLISDHLNRFNVAYRYEKPLQLSDWNRKVTFRPDFTVMNRRTGRIFIYEHLGMMDDESYIAKNLKKLDLYEKNGFLFGKNLLVTHETSKLPLNMNIVDSYIKTFFL